MKKFPSPCMINKQSMHELKEEYVDVVATSVSKGNV